jgi:hypothetical protein
MNGRILGYEAQSVKGFVNRFSLSNRRVTCRWVRPIIKLAVRSLVVTFGEIAVVSQFV